MKVLFVRHGESLDDVENRYGGWADFPLTEKGESQLRNTAQAIGSLGVDFEIILTSPLKRALRSAEVLSEVLDLPIETLEYVKERNTYGLLSGMEKSAAGNKYPDQVKNLEDGKYVDGSERSEDLSNRVKKSLQMIEERAARTNLIVLTHGNYLKSLFEDVMNRKLLKKEDGGFVLMDLEGGNLVPVSSKGIEFE